MSIQTTLQTIKQQTGIPVAYSHFKKAVTPPFIVYMGDGQNQFHAEDTVYWRENEYTVEFYFTKKDEALEASIEDALLAGGFRYTKSEDAFIESEGVFVIYYYVN